MNSYVYNPLKAPKITRSKIYQPQSYEVVDEITVEQLRASGSGVIIEGDEDFIPLFVRNIPAKTPNKVA
ncbi:MAG: hypothetical protein M0R06_20735 [Sphaerochaeta sp.]|jgi:hypothetical protein|nr:hypothetical protein [Sphaerochaeta sp.]